ncbi:LmeA family phospholipid-binding protein [Leptothoe sp. PORK10 BA2]|jgi:hypothetical protein|uniref:LmeA family phospholipid-binding protein n=1 Tax=Leptothoe sp. PORK10 BA2 TaxID=3110254 RepID=UPI002B2021B8|nr:DUF2993 domain-containing protein [Leptothoe sp. PORK10 BA2]MEA5464541.1 DUF2993 domain-containing protein [Leptothoe sp. PORK10 BA2]
MTSFVLGNLPFPGQGGDQVVSKVVSTAIAALFKRTGKLDATVRAEPVAKLLQGSVDGFDFIGHSMLMYNGLRIKALELFVQAVSIDFGAVFKGQVRLKQPTQASLRVVLTEEDLTSSFNTPFVVEKLQQMTFEGQPLHFSSTEMSLNDDTSVTLESKICIGNETIPRSVNLTAKVEVYDRTKIAFVDAVYYGTDKDIALGQAIVEHVNDLMDLDSFALDGTQLRVDKVRMRNKELIFYGIAHINQFPQKK